MQKTNLNQNGETFNNNNNTENESLNNVSTNNNQQQGPQHQVGFMGSVHQQQMLYQYNPFHTPYPNHFNMMANNIPPISINNNMVGGGTGGHPGKNPYDNFKNNGIFQPIPMGFQGGEPMNQYIDSASSQQIIRPNNNNFGNPYDD